MNEEIQDKSTNDLQDTPTDDLIKPFIPELMKYLPLYYNKKTGFMSNVQNSFSEEIGRLNYLNKDMLDQSFVESATWGLDICEEELGIETDISKTYEARREAIIAKLRGFGTLTEKMLKNTALAFTNAEVEIIENYDDYSFVIKFGSTRGRPPNLQDFIDMIETIKPAHLDFDLEFIYNTNDDLRNYHFGWLSALTNDELRNTNIPSESEGITHEKMSNFTHQRLEVILYED
ncbi:putative phage tail protein [Wukongibacter baidiensis]|uniref:putative phage tail protein n=1 Tax=Wukongibacter baidiensis TaxID=1723361 RepID=UPI003D7FDB38